MMLGTLQDVFIFQKNADWPEESNSPVLVVVAVTGRRYSLVWFFHGFLQGFTLPRKSVVMIGIRLRFKMVVWLAVTVLGYGRVAATATSEKPADDTALLASICPVVYPLDQFPTERGYGYLFFGNAFFINEEGYLVTAAHVLDSFRDGGQPYILVNTPGGPRRLQKAELVAED